MRDFTLTESVKSNGITMKETLGRNSVQANDVLSQEITKYWNESNSHKTVTGLAPFTFFVVKDNEVIETTYNPSIPSLGGSE